jgi:tyrosine-protein phosphatase SIW14
MCVAAGMGLAEAYPENFHRVDGKVWRSAQPDRADFVRLGQKGIVEVLNLREWHSDSAEAEGLEIKLHRVRVNPGNIRDREMIRAVRILRDARGPVLVHCWHGSDRTGMVVALYRMAVGGWSRDEAIAEFLMPHHGHHAGVYPKHRKYLETVDVAAFKAAMDRGEVRRRDRRQVRSRRRILAVAP